MRPAQPRPSDPDQVPPLDARQRVRITYEKGESIKFISHQDEFRAWERALRRAGLPLLYKRGFNPQPHMQFSSPLGVGFSGARELLDITFSPPLPLEELRSRIAGSLPPGLTVHELAETPLNGPAMQTLLIGADYTLKVLASPQEIAPAAIERRIAGFLRTEEHWRTRERKGKRYQYNLRPLVLELIYGGYDAGQEAHDIFLRVQQREGATGRPDEVISELGLDAYARSLRRDRLYFSDRAEDADLFEQYRVVSKDEIAGDALDTKKGQRHVVRSRSKTQGRTIGERAADEFD